MHKSHLINNGSKTVILTNAKLILNYIKNYCYYSLITTSCNLIYLANLINQNVNTDGWFF